MNERAIAGIKKGLKRLHNNGDNFAKDALDCIAHLQNLQRRWVETVEACGRKLGKQDARIQELEAIVSRLPKTADGVPIAPGMQVWVISQCCGSEATDVWTFITQAVTDSGADGWHGLTLYSTEQAAREVLNSGGQPT